LALVLTSAALASAAEPQATDSSPIDLPTALRLAGAQNLDVQIAREHYQEAVANKESAVAQFFPWIAPGIGYHRRDGVAQAVPSGVISDAHFQSYSPGAVISAQLVLGDAIYNSLAAKQLVKASDQALESQRQDSILSAAQAWFDLSRAKAMVGVVNEGLMTSRDYQKQLHEAVAAGVAFKGDELRVQSQSEQYEIQLKQANERQRVEAANLARILHLDPRVELMPIGDCVAPFTLFESNLTVNALVEQGLKSRPEIKQTEALTAAARANKDGAVVGPWIPTLGATVYGGGLGGGPDGGPSNFGPEGDYTIGLSWKIGPGGLFDPGRTKAGKARLASAELSQAQLKDIIISQVVSSHTKVVSVAGQLSLARTNLATATQALTLTHDRKQYGVGAVLEDIQAQQDLTRARGEYLTAVAEHNKAQYTLQRAVGGFTTSSTKK
jgi:outer membrane protein TolC